MAIFSYDGGINFGVTGDYDTAPDIDVLCAGIEEGIAELLATVPAAKSGANGSGASPKPKSARQSATAHANGGS